MHSSSKSSKNKSKRWGKFSEWTWEPDRQFYYRVRQDVEGNLDYDYHTGGGQEVPRSSDEDVDNITQNYADLNIQSDPQDSEYQTGGGHSSTSTGKGRSSKSSRGKEKRSERYDVDDPGNSRRSPVTDESEGYTYTTVAGEGYPTGDASYYQSPYSAGSSSQANYSTTGSAYATSGATYETAYEPSSAAYYDTASAYAYPSYEPSDEDGRLTPRAASSRSQMAVDVAGALDPRYRVERSERFQPGEIFKSGWAEPKGAATDGLTGISGKQEIEDTRGVTFITGFRRFIVVANDQGHATCVPILSYGGKACKKNGVKAEKHGIIYQRGQRPKLLDGEPKLGFPPVKMDVTMEGEKISKESRVNYSKLVTVEHNVKVMFIGHITPNDWPIVPDAINRCWDQKDHHKRSRHRR